MGNEPKQRRERIDKGMIRPGPRRSREEIFKEKLHRMTKEEKITWLKDRTRLQNETYEFVRGIRVKYEHDPIMIERINKEMDNAIQRNNRDMERIQKKLDRLPR